MRKTMTRYYTEDELKYYMDHPEEVELVAEEHDLEQQWEDWCCESEGMTMEEIVEDFFFHFDLYDENISLPS